MRGLSSTINIFLGMMRFILLSICSYKGYTIITIKAFLLKNSPFLVIFLQNNIRSVNTQILVLLHLVYATYYCKWITSISKYLLRELNISTSTISRAFNGSPDINKDTKEKILAFAREHNFLPNHYASNLRDKKSRTLAVIVPEIANDFFAQAINGIEEIARKKGFYILLYRTDDVFDKEVSFVNYLNNGKADGIIMSVSGEANDHNYLRKLEQKNIPVVFFDRVYEDIEAAKVITNDYESSFDATEHLIETGCKR